MTNFITPIGYLFVAVVCIMLGGTAFFLYRMVKRGQEYEEKEETVLHDSSQILQQARKKSLAIIIQATDQAVGLFNDAHMTNEKVIEELDHILQTSLKKQLDSFHDLSDRFLAEYSTSLSSLKKTFETQSEQTFESMQKQEESLFSNVNATVQKDLNALPSNLEKKVADSLQQIDKETETYKHDQLQKIDASIKTIFLQTYQELLGKTIIVSVQNELLTQALETAKKEGVFAQ